MRRLKGEGESPPFIDLFMPATQVLDHCRQIQPLILQQYQQVIHQIRRFVLQFELVMHRRGQRGFYAFFPDLLRNTLGTAGVQLRGL